MSMSYNWKIPFDTVFFVLRNKDIICFNMEPKSSVGELL